MKILFFGDIVGKPGREAVKKILPELRTAHQPDLVLANGENLAHGKGVTEKTLEEMLEAGVEFFTSGNHIFDKPAVREVFEKYPHHLIRPANITGENLPGAGYEILKVGSVPVMIINLLGQVFMTEQFDQGEISNPFLVINKILNEAENLPIIKLVDFHAEATSEKRGMGLWTDGRVSAVLGTHTHVGTRDAQILSQGTGYLTDLGMVGGYPSIIGMDQESALRRLSSQGEDNVPKVRLDVAETSQSEIGYAVMEIDEQTGKCQNIIAELEYR